ncbi:MAG: class I SAM-dependent methyltransferase [Desulfobacterales bacterium]|nr:class I SAM-dependent methyltransferase [Desulfobacterales bacterium]
MYNPSFKGDVCSHRHAIFLDNFIRRLFQNPKKIAGPYINPGDTVLDLGCGPGYFSIDMAKMAGTGGRVFSVDLQEEMLSRVVQKSVQNRLTGIITPHRCTQENIGLGPEIKADFILAYYMVHETLDHGKFLSQVRALMKPEGRFLMVEPLFHVSRKKFEQIVKTAMDTGFILKDRPPGKGGRSVLLGI